MPENSLPSILIIDEELEKIAATPRVLNDSGRVRAHAVHPSDLEFADVAAASLVLVDQELKLDAAPQPLATWIPDGVALATALRRHLARSKEKHSPTAFALLSSELAGLADPWPVVAGRAQIARNNNLDWAFDKTDEKRLDQIISLAEAVTRVPESWTRGISGFGDVAPLLGLRPDEQDADTCWESIERCHPPIHEVSQWTHGIAFIRWLLQSILSYPCFLWDSRRVAARWRVKHSDFVAALNDSAALREWLQPTAYLGVLADFDGPRWWGHRVELLAWVATGGDAQNSSQLRKQVSERAGRQLIATESEPPVVCTGEDFCPLDETLSYEKALRVQPDGWPAYAETAWMPLERVRASERLRAMVVPDDKERIDKQ
jgi:hypothetical protein